MRKGARAAHDADGDAWWWSTRTQRVRRTGVWRRREVGRRRAVARRVRRRHGPGSRYTCDTCSRTRTRPIHISSLALLTHTSLTHGGLCCPSSHTACLQTRDLRPLHPRAKARHTIHTLAHHSRGLDRRIRTLPARLAASRGASQGHHRALPQTSPPLATTAAPAAPHRANRTPLTAPQESHIDRSYRHVRRGRRCRRA